MVQINARVRAVSPPAKGQNFILKIYPIYGNDFKLIAISNRMHQ
jgi:hypothetical protein